MRSKTLQIILPLLIWFANSQICPSECSTCLSSTNCTACVDTFTLVRARAKCIQCPANCQDCTFNSNNSTITCDACVTDFELGANGKCFKCNPICLTCSNFPGNCSSCA